MADWKDVGRLIGPLAPALGGVLGGFIPIPGAALAGQALGSVLASALGVPATPEAVTQAVRTSPNDVLVAKLAAAAEEARARWPAFAEAERAYFEGLARLAESVNVTMRGEGESWFFNGWRPAAGWIFDFFAVAFGLLLVWATIVAMSGNSAPLETIASNWTIYAAFFATLSAMVGVYVYARSKDKETASK